MKFSVLSLTYNHAPFIAQCIESVLKQTYSKWELIVLDDGSNDQTGTVVKQFLSDSRIRYYYQENQGPFNLAHNYNKLLSLATGEILTILEGDDYCNPELLASQYESFQDPEVVLSFCQVRVEEKDWCWISPKIPANTEEAAILNNHPPGKAYDLLLKQCFIPAQGISVRTRAMQEIGGFISVPGLQTVDYPTWLKIAAIGSFRFIPKPLATWRRHPHQLTRQQIVPLTKIMIPILLNTLNSLPVQVSRSVNILPAELQQYWERMLTIILIRGGRYKLIVKDWKTARQYYRESFGKWSAFLPVWRIKALLGILMSYLHQNMEWLTIFGSAPSKNKSKFVPGH
jgi:glycosyltransferase involved in cell wall biosynthesis